MTELGSFLKESAQKIGIDLTLNQIESFLIYLNELKEWNRKTNLTRIKTDKDIIIKHFLDSLTCWHIIPLPSTPFTLIDVGTGAGFPGIPLKIYNNAIGLSLLESSNKKIAFLEHICKKLSFHNANVIWGRAEGLAHLEKHRERFDIVVSRAVAKMNVVAEICLPFAKIGGKVIVFKGDKVDSEINKAIKAIKILGGEVENIKQFELFGMKRSFIILKKIGSSPTLYPRRPGIPNKRPL